MATVRICNVDGCQRKHKARGLCMMHYSAAPAGKAVRARYNATPARKAAQARNYAAYKERQQGLSERHTAVPPAPVPDLPQTDLEARQRALIRAMVKSAQETTTWDARQYLVELLYDAEGVRVLRALA